MAREEYLHRVGSERLWPLGELDEVFDLALLKLLIDLPLRPHCLSVVFFSIAVYYIMAEKINTPAMGIP